ncbi:MAG TPA: tripartite tricarboxylate transporter substrate binding protein [Burkholderiales bacterium]|nr:tripartite tricarboxylate transporter substrate binding protein [Burkholderiales bacterium]
MKTVGFVVAASLLPASFCAHAQTYPAKPIRIIIPFPIGGIADVFARVIGGKLNEAWGQPVVIENRAGAGGNIAAEYVVKSPPDGYTLVVGSIGTHAVNVSLFKKIPFDPVRDFAPISMMLEAEGLLVLHPSVPAKNIKELIALAKARPGQIIYASAGNGTAGHLSGELLKSMAKVDMVHVPYKGNVPAITDLIGGQTSLLFATMPTVLPHVKSGRLNAIAVTGAKRSPAAPDLPAIAETLPGYDVTNWVGAFAPAGTPRDVVNKLHAEIVRVMQAPDIQKRLLTEGAKFTPLSPDQFAGFVKSEITKWAKVIQQSGIRVD